MALRKGTPLYILYNVDQNRNTYMHMFDARCKNNNKGAKPGHSVSHGNPKTVKSQESDK